MCAECEGLGRVSTVDLDALVDRDKSLNEGAITFPGFGVGTWYHRIFVDSGFFDNDKPLRDFTDAEWERFLHGPEAKVKTELREPHLRGPDRQDPQPLPHQGRRIAPAHPARGGRAGRDVRGLPLLRRARGSTPWRARH